MSELKHFIDENKNNYPYFGETVFENLPEALKPYFQFSGKRENDVFLNSLFPALGIAMPNLFGIYDNRPVYPCLYSINCAPAASGKGVQNYITDFLNIIEDDLNKNNLNLTEPKRIILPANSSSAAFCEFMIKHEKAMINETEIDSLVNVLKQEWGDFSDILRKAYHHETISVNRKDNQYFKLKSPRLSISLAGTEDQFKSLFISASNGLFSRFMFYKFHELPVFRNVLSGDKKNYQEIVKSTTINLLPILNKINAMDIEFELTKEQCDKHQVIFENLLKEAAEKYGESGVSSVFRLGIIFFRIAMILTAIRHAESDKLDSKIICSELDFQIVEKMNEVYYKNMIFSLETLPFEAAKIDNLRANKLLDCIPTDIQLKYNDIRKLALEKGICKDRSVSTYIKKLVQHGYLNQAFNNGPYIKSAA